MDVFEAIEKRYSYRGPFRDIPIPREHLRKIVEAGIRRCRSAGVGEMRVGSCFRQGSRR